MPTQDPFDYDQAFSRNIGWFTDWEQQILRSKKIAIAGMGGVGGLHLLSLARLGIGHFKIADPDTFELANFNRQAGALISSLNQAKTSTLQTLASDIHPDIKIETFPQGVTVDMIDDFLKDADLFIDGLDFFALDIRRKIFKRCQELRIPALTAAPLGMGTAYITFMPDGMSFEKYFGFTDDEELNQLKFLIGLNPAASHRAYLLDRSKVNMKNKTAPSTIIGCTLAAGVVAAEAVKILLQRGEILSAPWYQSFDPYLNQYQQGYLSDGSENWLHSFRLKLIKSFLLKGESAQPTILPSPDKTTQNDLEKICEFASWTPSGDNSQPWKFEIKNEHEVTIHVHNEGSVYDFAGKPSLLTLGFFIESFQIAAAHFGYRIDWTYEKGEENKHLTHFRITKDSNVEPNNLFYFLRVRSVNRFPYKSEKLTDKQKNLLENSLGDRLTIRWFETLNEKFQIANLNAMATLIRLSIPETYEIHKKIIDFKNAYSTDKVPSRSLGVIGPIQKMMEFELASWQRVHFMNRFLGAAVLPQLELDYLPGIFCSGHFIIEWKNHADANNPTFILSAGQHLQRFWLTMTKFGLAMQPGFAPLAFAYYAKNKIPFTKNSAMQNCANKLAQQLDHIAPHHQIVFIGRAGTPRTTLLPSRSIRKNLYDLMNN